jgi:hypothetical protein
MGQSSFPAFFAIAMGVSDQTAATADDDIILWCRAD